MMFIEREIVYRLAECLLQAQGPSTDQGLRVTVCGERGYDPDATGFTREVVPSQLKPDLIRAVLAEADKYDEVHLFLGGNYAEGYGDWVYLIFGNGNSGWDVISDYTTDLEPIIKPVFDWIEKEGANG